MDLGYRSRRETPPFEIDGVILKSNAKSYWVKLDGIVTPMWLPQSQVEFAEDGTENGKPHGRFSIPRWLAKKEGLTT